jgi:hypothetical protein
MISIDVSCMNEDCMGLLREYLSRTAVAYFPIQAPAKYADARNSVQRTAMSGSAQADRGAFLDSI